MKKEFITLSLMLLSYTSYCQIDNQSSRPEKNIYQLFPTKNQWTFIKLDTRNGKMWQVHFSLNSDNRRQTELNSSTLVTESDEVNGRFTLYPTENIYNFLLLDQIDGRVYQIQWSMDEKLRGVVPISVSW